jgi:hypothetical protein
VRGLSAPNGTTTGAVVNDPRRERTSSSEITIYKAMSIAMEDMVTANLACRRAQRSGLGTRSSCSRPTLTLGVMRDSSRRPRSVAGAFTGEIC